MERRFEKVLRQSLPFTVFIGRGETMPRFQTVAGFRMPFSHPGESNDEQRGEVRVAF
jgi:hypothetical protein